MNSDLPEDLEAWLWDSYAFTLQCRQVIKPKSAYLNILLGVILGVLMGSVTFYLMYSTFNGN